jgi:hypothetical protein
VGVGVPVWVGVGDTVGVGETVGVGDGVGVTVGVTVGVEVGVAVGVGDGVGVTEPIVTTPVCRPAEIGLPSSSVSSPTLRFMTLLPAARPSAVNVQSVTLVAPGSTDPARSTATILTSDAGRVELLFIAENSGEKVAVINLATDGSVIVALILNPASPSGTESRVRAVEPMAPAVGRVRFCIESVTAEQDTPESIRREIRTNPAAAQILPFFFITAPVYII